QLVVRPELRERDRLADLTALAVGEADARGGEDAVALPAGGDDERRQGYQTTGHATEGAALRGVAPNKRETIVHVPPKGCGPAGVRRRRCRDGPTSLCLLLCPFLRRGPLRTRR